jgi:hypothetical protein
MLPIRTLGAALLVFLLCPSIGVSASEYTVSYAFDAGDLTDASSGHCKFEEDCRLQSEKLSLMVWLTFYDPTHEKVDISVYGINGRRSCCYFYDGAESVSRNTDSLVHLRVYEGRRRKQNEFRLNTPLGVLYLQFTDGH